MYNNNNDNYFKQDGYIMTRDLMFWLFELDRAINSLYKINRKNALQRHHIQLYIANTYVLLKSMIHPKQSVPYAYGYYELDV
jgi:hypothetical protein